ncbi:hypothetical protein CBR_g52310 [Chara braunii]|uniref:HAT C-terminal dimerisation domain-containing protein n=1 Tax=Chara braunii TaxID=69332 RepID=A0A388K6N0_CHABU|nr:hypothetical protein CBR_g52310 [Chara braunii]|eukprot:GBG65715.1 hypothetical protein CBR_g52310 [Chara braunii]
METQDMEPLVPGYEEPQPPTTAGMAPPKTASRTESVVAANEGLAEGSASNTRVASLQQTSIKRWVDNDAQKKLDIAWAEAMFRAGIAFNFLNFDTTQKLHEVYLEVANARPKVKLPSYKHMRTFGSVYMMLERLLNRKAVLSDMVDRKNAARWTGIRWSTAKLKSKVGLLYFTMRRDGWWTKLKKVVDVMKPFYSLLRRMDQDGTSSTNLMEYDDLIERKLAHVVLTDERRASVMEKARDRVKMMRQPVHALAFLLDPCRRNPRWLYDRDSEIVQNAMLYLQRQAIAIKVMGMWSTATPTERNWASMDFVHLKRRNNLKPETLDKLVYIHWNMQLLRAANNSGTKGEGYVDLWSSFFEAIPEPDENDGSVLRGPEEETEKTDEELVWQSSFVKPPKRIPKKLEDKEDECTDDSDLDDELWTGRGGLSDETSDEEEEEDESDSDFELGAQPSVPGTTYVSRREPARRRRENQPAVSTQVRGESSSRYHPQPDVEFHHMDTDIELLLQSRLIDEDEAEANRAKALADRDKDAVQKRIMEEDARRAAIPTRREIERHKKKVGEKEPETRRSLDVVQEQEEEEQQQEVDQQEADHRKEEDKQEADQQEAEHHKEVEEKGQQEDKGDMDHAQEPEMEHGEEDEEMKYEEDEEGMESQGVEEAMEQQDDAEGMDPEDLQHNMDDEDAEEEHQPAMKTVYTRRPRPVLSAQSVENSPDFPHSNEVVQHDNLWVSRVGRKRKEPVEDAAAKPKRARGRPPS